MKANTQYAYTLKLSDELVDRLEACVNTKRARANRRDRRSITKLSIIQKAIEQYLNLFEYSQSAFDPNVERGPNELEEVEELVSVDAPHDFESPVAYGRRNTRCKVCGRTARHRNHSVVNEA